MQEETNTFSKHQKVGGSELYNSSYVDFSEEGAKKFWTAVVNTVHHSCNYFGWDFASKSLVNP